VIHSALNPSFLQFNCKEASEPAKEHGREPRWPEIEQAIRRNFGGLDEIDPVKIFRKYFPFSRNDKVGVMKNVVVLDLPAKLPPYFTTW